MKEQIFKTHNDYRSAWAKAYTETPDIPLNIDIELASICNLACPFCFWGESDFNEDMKSPALDGKPKKRFMETEMALNIIQEASDLGVPAIKMNWRGESTMHPDYKEILKFAWTRFSGPGRRSFFDILVNTNANCKDAAINGLMYATKVMVSLDSTIPETYKKMRVNGNLDRAIEVTKELLKRGHKNVWVRRVMTKDNKDEPFAVDVRRIFGPKVKISEHACFDRNADEHHQMNDPKFDRTYCGYPSQRMMIASDGTVYPCCVDYDGTMPMGKYPKESLEDIWLGDPFVELRTSLMLNEFESDACKKCTSWMAYKAPEREMVQDKEIKI